MAEAGRAGMITIATNMAGRGTDIKLGPGVKEAGGLAIVGTERHDSRRVDRQLRGRAGRQGDPGSSQFFVSLEDDLMRMFGSDRIAGLSLPPVQGPTLDIISAAGRPALKYLVVRGRDAGARGVPIQPAPLNPRAGLCGMGRQVVRTRPCLSPRPPRWCCLAWPCWLAGHAANGCNHKRGAGTARHPGLMREPHIF